MGIEGQVCESDHSPLSITSVKNSGAITPLPNLKALCILDWPSVAFYLVDDLCRGLVLLIMREIILVLFCCFSRAAEITDAGQGVPPTAGPAKPAKQSGMGDRDWQPFVYGGLASCIAEFGMCSNKNMVFISLACLMKL
jgi:hypothetical protein